MDKNIIHNLKFIGGSLNGRKDNMLAPVYICKICDRMGYIEEFKEIKTCVQQTNDVYKRPFYNTIPKPFSF